MIQRRDLVYYLSTYLPDPLINQNKLAYWPERMVHLVRNDLVHKIKKSSGTPQPNNKGQLAIVNLMIMLLETEQNYQRVRRQKAFLWCLK